MKVMSCNIRYYGAEDGPNDWGHRKDICAEAILNSNPDIVCFQEMWGEQHADMAAAMNGFDWVLLADMPTERRPMNAIAYRREAFVVISSGGYWLSETPHISGSKSWDSMCVRLANWARLADRASGRELRIVNTHLDHIGEVAQPKQANIIVEDTAAYPPNYPQILTGDMNADARSRAIAIYKESGWIDTYAALHGPADPGHTAHAFLGPEHDSPNGKIDWIFVRGQLKPTAAAIHDETYNGRYPSDHYFLSATIEFDTK